ncbi:hypothetical protein [Paenibacillus sp. NEAU-GSW1]|uniref:hypothetical protein n=1 Tax=Paenibacillus sp. NEAU-GSW1 TaxID=2682486 RepID=UPI001C12BCB7|nr:hypothetical protein [Paenibacillus sp. NEAU-GSW1]
MSEAKDKGEAAPLFLTVQVRKVSVAIRDHDDFSKILFIGIAVAMGEMGSRTAA